MNSTPTFKGTSDYIADSELMFSVNAAVLLGRPLLIKGEPGTGKTVLAKAVAHALELDLMSWHVKSTTKAVDGLYHYDVVQRLNDSRFGGSDVSDIRNYIRLGPMGEAFSTDKRVVLLIDEVDKADLEFPNDLLRELDEMAFFIPELNEEVRAKHRPVVIITSNAEKELPDAFLRRCVFHYLAFPERNRMKQILDVHHPTLDKTLLDSALAQFYAIREVPGLSKPPSTSELIDWITVLIHGGASASAALKDTPYLGVLLKNDKDQARIKAPTRRY